MSRRFWWVALAVVLVVAVGVSAFASAFPDGLESASIALGFEDAAADSAAAGGPFADYGVFGVSNPFLSNGLAGLVGVVVVGAVMIGLTRALRRA